MAHTHTHLDGWSRITFRKTTTGGWTALGKHLGPDGVAHFWAATATTKMAAEARLRSRVDPASTTARAGMTIESLFLEWVVHQRMLGSLDSVTVMAYERTWWRSLHQQFGHLTVREVTHGDLIEHLSTLNTSSRRRARVVLNGMFDLASSLDIIERNPLRDPDTNH